MARYGAEHKDRTRRRIVETSGRRLEASGLAGSGVSTLMADAGLTNGAFYGHFASKDQLVADVIADQLAAQRDGVADPDLERVVRAYLSVEQTARAVTDDRLSAELLEMGVRSALAGLPGAMPRSSPAKPSCSESA